MISLENAVTDTLEELELEEHVEAHIREVDQDRLYHVTFQEKANGNNRMVVSVAYSTEVGDLMDDESWEGEIEIDLVSREGMGPMTAQVILELLAITLDEDYYDSDSEDEEEDSDDETESLPSEPRTPPPRASRPLVVPRLQLPQRNLP
jgi:hypothetical protein